MAIRPFGYQTLTGQPQPAFGSKVATSFNVTPDQYTGNTDPRSQGSYSQVPVTTGTGTNFRVNDAIEIGVKGGPYDRGRVVAIATDTLTVQGLTKSHAAGEFVIIGINAANILIQANANNLYIGTDAMTASTSSPGIFTVLGPLGTYGAGESNITNAKGTSAYWVYGTSSDTFLPGLDTV